MIEQMSPHAATDTVHPLVRVPKRRRVLLEQALFPEIATVKATQDAIKPKEIRNFLWTIYEHESDIAIASDNAATGNILPFGNAPLPTSYVVRWKKSFLEVVRLYANQTSNYADAVEISDEFRQTLPHNLRSRLSTGKRPLNDRLIGLSKNGIPARQMGAINAHHFIPHILQLYCGLYSHDMRDIPRPLASGFGDDKIPNPNIGAFQRRQNIRLTEIANIGEFDPAVGSVRYNDLLSAKLTASVWNSKSRKFYEQGIFRLPGLKQADEVFDFIKRKHNSDVHSALDQLWQEAQRSMMRARQEPSALRQMQHAENRSRYQMASLGHPTGCLMNQQGIYRYVGSELADMLDFIRIPDVYPRAVRDFDWQKEVGDKWRDADAKLSARPKKPPKTTRETHQARIADAERRAREIAHELAEARMALNTYERDQAIKAEKAAQRRAAAEQKRQQEAEERQAEIKRMRDAEEKAEKTREQNRAAARELAARRNREQEDRRKKQQSAQAKATTQKLADQSRPPLTEAERQERIERNKAREKNKRKAEQAARKAGRDILLDIRTFKKGKPTRKYLRHKKIQSSEPEI